MRCISDELYMVVISFVQISIAVCSKGKTRPSADQAFQLLVVSSMTLSCGQPRSNETPPDGYGEKRNLVAPSVTMPSRVFSSPKAR